MTLNPFAECVNKEPYFLFFYFTALFTLIKPDLEREVADLGYRICPDCQLCSFTIHLALHSHGLQTVSLQSLHV